MIKLHTAIFILAIATLLAMSGPASAVINNGGGGGNGVTETCDSSIAACQDWCMAHNKTEKSQGICFTNCEKSHCRTHGIGTEPAINKGGTINGKPVQAPPPKGGNPPKKGGNAAPIIKGNPVQASPGGTGTDHPVLERNGSGKH